MIGRVMLHVFLFGVLLFALLSPAYSGCIGDCWFVFEGHVNACANFFPHDPDSLQACLNGKMPILDACLATCLPPPPNDSCSVDCATLHSYLIRASENAHPTNGAALKTCLDGANSCKDACLANCPQPKPNAANLQPDNQGFLPPIPTGATTYTVSASIDDPGGIVANVEFHLIDSNLTDHLLGLDSNPSGGWGVTFNPSTLGLSATEGSAVPLYIKVQNTSGDQGVAGDAAPARVFSTTGVSDPDGVAAKVTRLYQNRPNPFNPRTEIKFSLAADGKVKLVIYEVNGRRIRTLVDKGLTAGMHSVVWDGTDDCGRAVTSGVYWSQLQAGDYLSNKRMIVLN